MSRNTHVNPDGNRLGSARVRRPTSAIDSKCCFAKVQSNAGPGLIMAVSTAQLFPSSENCIPDYS